MSNIIQNSVFPTFSLCSQIDLYFRHNEFVDLDMANSNLKIKRKGRVTTDTYFNSLVLESGNAIQIFLAYISQLLSKVV